MVIFCETTGYWVDVFNSAGEPCGQIYNIKQTFKDVQVKHLGVTEKLKSQEYGEIEFVKQPMFLERTPSSFVMASPECRKHTNEILFDIGCSEEKINDLRKRNTV